MENLPVYSNLEERHRQTFIWKPIRDHLDTRCEHILERCQSTNHRLKTLTCSDVLAEIGAALTGGAKCEQSFEDSESAIDTDITAEDLRDPLAASPDGAFSHPARLGDRPVLQPRTSSPIEYNTEDLAECERREVWRKRVLSKRPILFRTYCAHRQPQKSYQEHRRISRGGRRWPRRALIDSPLCRTPTSKAMRVSWTCLEDVLKQEGILSSPVSFNLLGSGSESATPVNIGACEVLPFDEPSPTNNESQDDSGTHLSDSSCSDPEYRILQQEIIDKVRRDVAAQTPLRTDSLRSPRSSMKAIRGSRGYVATRTSRRKLAMKKARLLNPNARSFLPPSSPESDDQSPASHQQTAVHQKTDGPASITNRITVSPNINRNASIPPAEVDKVSGCGGTASRRVNGPALPGAKGKVTDLCTFEESTSNDFRSDRKGTSPKFSIPTLTSFFRDVHIIRGDTCYKSANMKYIDHRERNDRSCLTRSFSNPNLIVIVPSAPADEGAIGKRGLRRSRSNPDFSLSIREDNEVFFKKAFPIAASGKDLPEKEEVSEAPRNVLVESLERKASPNVGMTQAGETGTRYAPKSTMPQVTPLSKKRKSFDDDDDNSDSGRRRGRETVDGSRMRDAPGIEPLMGKPFHLQRNGMYSHKRSADGRDGTQAAMNQRYFQRFNPSFRCYRVNDAYHYYGDAGAGAKGAPAGNAKGKQPKRNKKKTRVNKVKGTDVKMSATPRQQPQGPMKKNVPGNPDNDTRNGSNVVPDPPISGGGSPRDIPNAGPYYGPGGPRRQPPCPPPNMNRYYGQAPPYLSIVRPPPGFNLPPRCYMRMPPPMMPPVPPPMPPPMTHQRVPLLPVPLRFQRPPVMNIPTNVMPPRMMPPPGMMPPRMVPHMYPFGVFHVGMQRNVPMN